MGLPQFGHVGDDCTGPCVSDASADVSIAANASSNDSSAAGGGVDAAGFGPTPGRAGFDGLATGSEMGGPAGADVD
jgi:hypothetical protein